MKKLILPLILIVSIGSCDVYRPATEAKCVRELSQNPFVQNIAKRLMSDMAEMLLTQGIKMDSRNVNLKTPLSSLLTSAEAVRGFKNILTNTYQIPSGLVENNYSKMTTIGSVVSFLTDNANFNF